MSESVGILLVEKVRLKLLCHSVRKINSLLDAAKNTEKRDLICYVVQWKKKNWEGSNLVLSDTYTSYFYGANLKEVVDKFYYEKSPDEIVVYHIEMVSAS